jgi:hypothetical protein
MALARQGGSQSPQPDARTWGQCRLCSATVALCTPLQAAAWCDRNTSAWPSGVNTGVAALSSSAARRTACGASSLSGA